MPSKKKLNKVEESVLQDPMMQILQVKRPYEDKEMIEYSHNIADALGVITEKELELKEFASEIKSAIAEQDDIVTACAVKIRMGYEMIPVECVVTYDKNIVTFVSKETGEIVEQREITEEEQMRLTSKWVDAEQVIRESSEEE